MKTLWVAAIAATLAVGCKIADDDVEPAVVPKTVAFEGKTDPKYVGIWRSVDASSVLDLAADGTLNIDSISTSVNGRSKSHVIGLWLASGDNLLFEYADASGAKTTLRYDAKLEGNTLVMQQPGGRLKTTYRRK